ncbi:hypothetical protein HER39_13405, partial [Arthrobacter deserti]|nr:hypothetical protein [Arthrobacter deserti]
WNQIIAVGVLGFVIMGAGVYWATTRRPSHGQAPGTRRSSAAKGGFMSSLEDRWDQRRNGEDR